MNIPLTYTPAYLGLFASLLLALACNSFLDIKYGSFATEVIIWAGMFAFSLSVGWRQKGESDARGEQFKKIFLILGFVGLILWFIPMWGFPRAGLYFLAALQAAQNCVLTNRRQLYFGLLVSLVMVMFAATHFRADWTMLFYLMPYVVAVVFTLVAEQVSRRTEDLRQASLGHMVKQGQGTAIAAATAVILLSGGLIYLATPQVTWPYLEWRYGQLSTLGFLNESDQSPQPEGGSGGQQQGDGGEGAQGGGASGMNGRTLTEREWPTPDEMREAAKRPGMPEWQSKTMMQMADAGEFIQKTMQPLMESLQSAWDQLKAWLAEHRIALWATVIGLLIAVLLAVLYFLSREIRVVIWLRSRYDYFRLGIFAHHQTGAAGARQYYLAMERLFAVADNPRLPAQNTREYLRDITHYRDHLWRSASELTQVFEQSRYGQLEPNEAQLRTLREHYRLIFKALN